MAKQAAELAVEKMEGIEVILNDDDLTDCRGTLAVGLDPNGLQLRASVPSRRQRLAQEFSTVTIASTPPRICQKGTRNLARRAFCSTFAYPDKP